ncbi:DNA polymerase III subunit beta [Candidatus Sumerlaeota bacterium]|nr:DNA polymerase III subunit beta [Candidatus Sumerlaeota bacterium]
MKIKFNKEDLSHATRVVSSMVPPQTSLPILGNILIRAAEEQVVFFACDMESSVRCAVKARIEEEGEITVPALPFSTLVRELPEAEVLIWLDKDENVHVESERNVYRLQTMSPSDFPSWSEFDPVTSFDLPRKDMRKMIDKTIFAVPTKDPRKVLLGAFLNIDTIFSEKTDVKDKEKPARIRMVATDGKKLGYIEVIASNLQGAPKNSAIIPQKVLAEIQKLIGDEGMVTVGLGERQIFFRMGDTEFITNKIEGDYPNYEMVIPKEFVYNISLEREKYISAIKRASIISESQNNSIMFHFSPGEVELSAMTFDLGSFQGSVPAQYEGDDFEVAFNFKYLLEVLHVIETESFTMHIKEPNLPVIFHEKDMPDTLYLVMPIKLSSMEKGAEE